MTDEGKEKVMSSSKTTEPTIQNYLLKPQSGYSRDMTLRDLTVMCREIGILDFRLKAQAKSSSYTAYGAELLKTITDSVKIEELSKLIGIEHDAVLTQVEKVARTDKSVRSPGEVEA